MQLAGLPHVRVIMIGGVLRQMPYSTVGPQAEQVLSGLNADHLFLGVDGLDPEIGLTTPDVHEAQLNALMIRVSREVTVVADSSKFGRRSMSVIGGLGDIDRLITDHRAEPAFVAALRAHDIDVRLIQRLPPRRSRSRRLPSTTGPRHHRQLLSTSFCAELELGVISQYAALRSR